MIQQFQLDNLTSEDLATLLNVTDRAIRKWVQSGLPHRFVGKDLRFDWEPCLAWWVANRYRGSVATSADSKLPTKADSEARILATKAKRDEMRLLVEEKKLVPLAEIEPAWLQVAERIKNRVLTLAERAKAVLPHLTSDDVKTLRGLCREALEDLSRCPSSKG